MSVSAKPKRRNSEKRKEKSRDAARCRRNQETGIFYELAHELPISYSLLSQLDKASVIRLTITHLKLRQILANAPIIDSYDSDIISADLLHKLDQQYYKSLDGFLVVVARKGDIVYVSENVEKYLGLTQVDMLGHSLIEFAHPCDHEELRDLVSGKIISGNTTTTDDRQRSLFARMKCTLTTKGRNINIKSAAFKVIHFSGNIMLTTSEYSPCCTVLVGRPIPGHSAVELAVDGHTFVSRHSLDLRFVYCDEEMTELIGYTPDDVLGKSVLSYHDARDADTLDKAYKILFAKGQSVTGLYRFLAKNGGFVWMETKATMVGDGQVDGASCVICINHVVSGVECQDVVFADVQCPQQSTDVKETVIIELEDDADEVVVYDDNEEDAETDSVGMQFVTEKFLASKGFKLSVMPTAVLHTSMDKSPMLTTVNSHVLNEKKADDNVGHAFRRVGSSSSLDNIPLDDLDCSMEFRAPYIPMDDMIFATSSLSSCVVKPVESVPIDLTTCTSNTLDVDALFSVPNSTQNSTTVKRTLTDDHLINLVLPAYKVLRLNADVTVTSSPSADIGVQQAPVTSAINGSPVLLNLLTTGVDTNWGYRLRDAQEQQTTEVSVDSTTPSNAMLTSLLRHLLSPSSSCDDVSGGINCMSRSEMLFHIAVSK